MGTRYLLLSLGHNSSAVYYDSSNDFIIGYEQERFDKVKASSAYPIDAINEIAKHVDFDGITVGVSHWFNNTTIENKYFDREHINKLVNDNNGSFLQYRDHHQLHALSSINFSLEHGGEKHGKALVIDGFGNNYQSISFYDYMGHDLIEEFSYKGYIYSLGLMFQYCTAYLGMKENQDEYKLLGYESHISQKEYDVLDNYLHKYFTEYYKGILKGKDKYIDTSSLIDYKLLQKTRENVYKMCSDVMSCETFKDSDPKIVIGCFAQSLLERVVDALCTYLGAYREHLCLSGGVFYNVKLNNRLAKKAKSLSIIPVCGDQGAALGYVNNLKLGDLCLGIRSESKKSEKIFDFRALGEAIANGKIVNLVHSNMEFGPRALCHTSTLALPKQAIIDDINTANGRTTVMPCAPVMLRRNATYFFERESLDKVVGSNDFMIITHDYKDSVPYEKYSGVMHNYPVSNKFSGRPQLVDENSPIGKILDYLDTNHDIKCLVNTSFNVHGVPIIFNYGDAKLNNDYQKKTINDIIFYYANSL